MAHLLSVAEAPRTPSSWRAAPSEFFFSGALAAKTACAMDDVSFQCQEVTRLRALGRSHDVPVTGRRSAGMAARRATSGARAAHAARADSGPLLAAGVHFGRRRRGAQRRSPRVASIHARHRKMLAHVERQVALYHGFDRWSRHSFLSI